ncbi:MAG: hypothetical protein PHP70_03230 [Gallionella sp.]|nr:hypothetical protein [Gallionella sp.]
MTEFSIIAVFLIGLLGGVHCFGLCGIGMLIPQASNQTIFRRSLSGREDTGRIVRAIRADISRNAGNRVRLLRLDQSDLYLWMDGKLPCACVKSGKYRHKI